MTHSYRIPLISLVIPVYNEALGIESFHTDLLLPVLKSQQKYSFRIIYVNDGSNDLSLSKLQAIADRQPNVTVLSLSRNFGKEIATSAGIASSSGGATIILDADGQHPPENIPDFIRLWEQGNLVVTGVRENSQHESFTKRFGSKLFYHLLSRVSQSKVVPGSTDFRLIDSVVRNEFIKLKEKDRITRGLIDWLGFKTTIFVFHAPTRLNGKASYTTSKLVGLAITSLTSLSLKPLFITAWLGGIIILLSIIVGLSVLVEQVFMGDPLQLHITGSAMLGIFVSFLVGIVLVSQGVIAVYISHIHAQSQGRPLYVIDPTESRNLLSS